MNSVNLLLTLLTCTVLPAQMGMGGQIEVVDEGATMEDKLGSRVSTDISLVDDRGYPINLKQFFPGVVPVILNLGYFGCPGLCGAITNGMVDALSRVDLEPGEDFLILTTSVHPTEDPVMAGAKKRNYLPYYRKQGAASAWYFLTGEPDQTRALASSVGFRFRWLPEENRIDHPPTLVFLSPDGVVTRYLKGPNFDAGDMRLAIVEASAGEVGTFVGNLWDRIKLSCLIFDPRTGKYTMTVYTVMRIGGVLTLVLLTGMILFLLRRERQSRTVVATT